MKCSQCGGGLSITHTYPVGSLKYQRAICDRCSAVFRLDTVAVLASPGAGARAMASRAKKEQSR